MADENMSDLAARLQEDDPEFLSLYREVKERAVVLSNCCYMIYRLAKYAQEAPGSFAEVGVYRGGTARLVARACPAKEIHLFDTFSGIPGTAIESDHHQPGDFSDTSLESVRDYLSDCSNVRIYPGVFPDTATPLAKERFSFVFIDTDIYRSVQDCIGFFVPRLVSGGIMLFDDYGMRECPGVKKAIDEFLNSGVGGFVLRTHAGTLDQAVLVKSGDPSRVPQAFPFV